MSKLKWKPKYNIYQLVNEMMEKDFNLVKRELTKT